MFPLTCVDDYEASLFISVDLKTPGLYQKLSPTTYEKLNKLHKLSPLDQYRKDHSIIVTDSQEAYLLMHTFSKQEREEFISKYPAYNCPAQNVPSEEFNKTSGYLKSYSDCYLRWLLSCNYELINWEPLARTRWGNKDEKYTFIAGRGFQSKFRIGRRINNDGLATLGKFVGIKKTSANKIDMAIAEAQLYEKMKINPSLKEVIVSSYGFLETNNSKGMKTAYHIMELADGGDGLRFIKEIENKALEDRENKLLKVASAFLKALATLHRYGFYHGDMKPDNFILFDDEKVALIDFGAGVEGKGRRAFNYCDENYLPPESVLFEEEDNEKNDSWAAGMVLLQLCGANVEEIYNKNIVDIIHELNKQNKIPEKLRPIINGLLNYNLSKRLMVQKVAEQLEDLTATTTPEFLNAETNHEPSSTSTCFLLDRISLFSAKRKWFDCIGFDKLSLANTDKIKKFRS